MANASVVSSSYSTRPAGLVSVNGQTYPLKAARVEAHAEGGIAATTLTQAYGNPYEEPLEVLYTLPLPANGAVIGYVIRLGKRVIRGEVRRRAEAQAEYRKALIEGRTAALLEQERADTFTQKLGSLPPGETAEIEIEVLQPLAFLPADGEWPPQWEYRFPTVVGVRYEGAEGRVPDAEKLDVDRAGGEGTSVRLEASLLVADGSAGAVRPHAPGHEIDLEDRERGVRVVLREKMKLDRDLVIRWSAARQEVGVRVVEGKGLPCDDGRYLLITLTPPAAVRNGLSRDLTLLIDASGSMADRPISRARMVSEQLLNSLDPRDRFEVLAFSDDVKRLVPEPMEASAENIRKALAALEGLQAGGSTQMTSAVLEALKPLRPDSQRQVILLTDGYIGFEGEVIREVLRRLAPGARLHTVGIGSAPNRTLTRGAARAGRGVEILVGDDEDARAASRRLLQATVRPVLTDLEFKGSALVSLAPQRPQDVLEGQPLVLLAEIKSTGGLLEIRGKEAGAPEAWIRRLEIPAGKENGQSTGKESASLLASSLPLGALFGREAIEDLELQLAAAGRGAEGGTLETKIENLGLRHGIASRKTSLVAISEDPTVDPKDARRRERLAVELPAEVSAEGTGLMPRAMLVAPTLCGVAELDDVSFATLESPGSARERHHQVRSGSLRQLRFREARVRGFQISEARVLRLDGQILMFEFEVPATGFLLPHDGTAVRVRFDDGIESIALVLGRESSPSGPHQAGLTVRLALKLKDHHCWHHNAARVHWTAHLRPPVQESDECEVDLEITLGARL